MQTNEIHAVPVTPIRKLLCRLPSLRRKRSSRKKLGHSVVEGDAYAASTSTELSPTRDRPLSSGSLGGRTSTSASTAEYDASHHCLNSPTRVKRAQIAIQQYDEVHDAIVISTLPCYPFCCYQDLLTMPRSRLIQTAYLFNSCLPFNARFTDLETLTDSHIRCRIEKLVGIVSEPRDDIHPDIKAISDYLGQCELDATTTTPPSSPLAMYPSRRNGMYSPRRSLDVLVEEDESDFSSYSRTFKKRKVDGESSCK